MTIECKIVDYQDPEQSSALVDLLNNYAKDPMGGSSPLSEDAIKNLAQELSKRPFAFSLIAYYDGQPAGLANCFEGFSTFKCKPLVNIHDLAVNPDYRGKGIATALLESIEQEALNRGSCKVTLEVLEGNKPALGAYEKFGFKCYELDPKVGKALFLEKALVK